MICLEDLVNRGLLAREASLGIESFLKRPGQPQAEKVLLELRGFHDTADISLYYSRAKPGFPTLGNHFSSSPFLAKLTDLESSPIQGVWLEYDAQGTAYSMPSPWFMMAPGKGTKDLKTHWPGLGEYLDNEPLIVSKLLEEFNCESPILGILAGRDPVTFRREIWCSAQTALSFLERISSSLRPVIQALATAGFSGPLTLQLDSSQEKLRVVGVNLIRPLEHQSKDDLLAILGQLTGSDSSTKWLKRLFTLDPQGTSLSHLKVCRPGPHTSQIKAYCLLY